MANNTNSIVSPDKKNYTGSNGTTLGNFFYDILRKNNHFKIIIYSTDGTTSEATSMKSSSIGSTIIEGYMSESLNFGISNNYSNAYSSNELLSKLGDLAEQGTKIASGANIGISHSLSGLLFWDTSSFNDMTFTFEILATRKDDNIILDTIRRLSFWVLPSQNSNFGGALWNAPGNYSLGGGILDQLSTASSVESVRTFNKNSKDTLPKGTVSVKVGNYFNIRGGVITNFQYTIDKEVMKDTGFPLKARISLTIKLVYPVSKERFESWFIN